jgi:putative DNA primase/helicase
MTIAEMAPETEECTIADPQARALVGVAIKAMQGAESDLGRLQAIRQCVAGLQPGADYDAIDHLADMARDRHGLGDDAITSAIAGGREAAVRRGRPAVKCLAAGADVGRYEYEAGETANNPTAKLLRPLNLDDFLRLELPPRRLILRPWLPEKGTAMIYAARGVGKTLLGLSACYAAASGGSFLDWTASEARRVLYVDGEMHAAGMQHLLAVIIAGCSSEAAPDYFRMLSADLSERGLPDLATAEGQRVFDDAIGTSEVVWLDNISTLCRSGKENEAEGWQSVQDWALKHRRAGRSIAFAHHAGKGGNQRGTSKREDVLDSVIALRRPEDYRAEQGARFEIHFEKHRGFFGADAEPFEAQYEERNGAAIWTRRTIANVDVKRVADAIKDGSSIREAADDLGMTKSKVERLKAKAKQQGLLDGAADRD